MKLVGIYAIDENNTFGARKFGKEVLPWPHISEDLAHFARKTKGAHLIMGRKTHESLVQRTGKPTLPGRTHHIVSRTLQVDPNDDPNVFVHKSIKDVVEHLEDITGKHEKVFVIGGRGLLEEFDALLDEIYQTTIYYNCTQYEVELFQHFFEGIVHGPTMNLNDYNVVSEQGIKTEDGRHSLSIVHYKKREDCVRRVL